MLNRNVLSKSILFSLALILSFQICPIKEVEARGFLKRLLFGGRISRGLSRPSFQRRQLADLNNSRSRVRNLDNILASRRLNDANNFDPVFDFAGSPLFDRAGSSVIDPSLQLSLLTNNIAQDRFGNLFELTGGAAIEVRQPLIRKRGVILGGTLSNEFSDSTLNDIRLLNARGSCDFNGRCSGNRLR